MSLTPTVLIHEVNSGGRFNGTASDGTDNASPPLYRGRMVILEDGTKGGLIQSPDLVGFTVVNLHFKAPGASLTEIYLVDPDGFEYLIHSEPTIPDNFSWPDDAQDGVFVPPLWYLKVENTGNLTGNGRCVFMLGAGWRHLSFDQFPGLGEE